MSNLAFFSGSIMGTIASSPSEPSAEIEDEATATAAAEDEDDKEQQASFPFLNLPPELRDCIYDFTLHTTEALLPRFEAAPCTRIDTLTPLQASILTLPPFLLPPTIHQQQQVQGFDRSASSCPAIRPSIRYRKNLGLLLGNKQVRDEYERRAKLVTTLVLKDNEKYTFQLIRLPEHDQRFRAHLIPYLELHLVFFCHHCCPIHPHFGGERCQAALEIARHRAWIDHLLPQLPALRSFAIHAYLCYGKCGHNKDKVLCESMVQRNLPLLYALPKLHSFTMYKYDFTARPDLGGPKEVMVQWDGCTKKETLNAKVLATLEPARAKCTAAGPSL